MAKAAQYMDVYGDLQTQRLLVGHFLLSKQPVIQMKS